MDHSKVLALAHYLGAWERLGAGARLAETASVLAPYVQSTSETALDRTRPCLSIIAIAIVAAGPFSPSRGISLGATYLYCYVDTYVLFTKQSATLGFYHVSQS